MNNKEKIVNSNVSGFLIRNHGGQKEVAWKKKKSAERKELPTQNPMVSDDILQGKKGQSKHSQKKEN